MLINALFLHNLFVISTMPKTVKTSIIPSSQTFARVDAVHEIDKEAICVFIAIGFFLDQDTFWKDIKCLRPATINTINDEGLFIKSEPWFQWHYTPQKIQFEEALNQFTTLFESIVDEQVNDKKVILPLSGGLDSRTQAVALKKLNKEVHSYSYDFKGGFPETNIAKKIANACNFSFSEFHIEKSYLWNTVEELAAINKCFSEFTHPRQMAIFNEFDNMGTVFSLGHWGDVLFDDQTTVNLSEKEQVALLLKKIVKKSGADLASELWKAWKLPGDFVTYLNIRIVALLREISIEDSNAKIRAFKSLYWAPRWTSTNLSIFEAKHPISLPYYDDRICEFICTIPEEYLAKRQLQIEYIKKQNPNVASIIWQTHKPYNLYNYHKNTSPNNLPYRILQKLKREGKNILGSPYIQRNWELQFLGKENDMHLKNYLFEDDFQSFIPKELIQKYYQKFKTGDQVNYSHAVSMLLTLSVWNKNHRNEE